MKNKKIKIFKSILIIILIILFIKIFFSKNLSNLKVSDDYLFLKLLSNGKTNVESDYLENDLSKKEILFKIDYKNIKLKSVDLSKTIDKNTLIHEKIAPGTKGSFNIVLNSNENLKYKIQFNSINEKPKNLKFKALRDEKLIVNADDIEELSNNLIGYINENETINITIRWYWDYESNGEDADIQDTKDAENIRRYQFDIVTVGEELA